MELPAYRQPIQVIAEDLRTQPMRRGNRCFLLRKAMRAEMEKRFAAFPP